MMYKSKDERYAVRIDDENIHQLIGYITQANRNETGGIIIGQYNDDRDCATVSLVTPAPPDSKSGHTWFERGVSGLQQLITRMWKKKDYYLGEWHFHPYAPPTPSRTDINQMVRIANSKQYNCPEPILLIIGGNPETYTIQIAVILPNENVVELLPEKEDPKAEPGNASLSGVNQQTTP